MFIMKKKKSILTITLIVASLAVSFKYGLSPSENLFVKNIEALTQTEGGTTDLQCSMTSPILYCGVLCRNCNTLWTVPGMSGQYIDGSSSCTCGATL